MRSADCPRHDDLYAIPRTGSTDTANLHAPPILHRQCLFTTKGSPAKEIELLGRPAFVTLDDGSSVYGMFAGYIYCGEHGVNKMGATDMVRRARQDQDLPWSKEFGPDEFDPHVKDPGANYDFEKHDDTTVYSMEYQRARERHFQVYGEVAEDERPPTHPDEQPYWNVIRNNIKAKKDEGSWAPPNNVGVRATQQMSAIRIARQEKTTPKQSGSADDRLNNLLQGTVLTEGVLDGHEVTRSGGL
ncbi:hypothetical protein SLS56_004404 [Neofusicoccum ribis]|uniref:Uncharacterized protein n=1 Tax=Neofusicoccum ribis TaxID=45134 RepID=A0ABR3SWM6_9PEZI